ncbi:capsid protein [Pseudogymnoascus destructans partitivirus-pa]|nr:capsid protein [Pseudogymnoascus destructans partitivirus-pa]AKR15081.1 capsid protein [Pseudogymnoascus destructans partitivirus-pa]AZT88583.1 coat protein [Pseudogymnoascus destructans partitivirus 1-pa]
MSSVVPTDSVSSSGTKRGKPGKRERAAAKSAVGSSGGQPASSAKAKAFAFGSSDPVPMPGQFPVVFQTGAGEPTRDQEFALDTPELSKQFPSVTDRYTRNPKYAEFRANAQLTNGQFGTHISAAFFLRLAQQIVHSHVNMGLPQGDFAPIASSDVRIPAGLASITSQFGEFSSPTIGTRFLLRDYEATVSKLVFIADKMWSEGANRDIIRRSWLPMSSSDGSTKVLVAEALLRFIETADVSISTNILEEGVLSGTVPDAWESIKSVLGEEPAAGQVDRRDRFDFLFKSYADVGQFVTTFSSTASAAVLDELDLDWVSPSAGHLDWSYSPKTRFSYLADQWAKLSAAYAQFFELSSGQATRQAATGSHSQMVQVSTTEGITILKTFMALPAPEFSLVACFPASCVFVGGLARRVIMTTSLNVTLRGTEFLQRDWR